MRIATKDDQELVCSIISKAFYTNPSVNMVIKQDAKKHKRIYALALYAFKTALPRNGVYISTDKTGVAVCYRYNIKKNSLKDYLNQIQLVVNSIGISNVIKVLKREAYINSKRLQTGNFLYFWFLGVTDEGRGKGAAKELREAIEKQSTENNIPIYLETSVPKNKKVYERIGFETYNTWYNQEQDTTIWFMRK